MREKHASVKPHVLSIHVVCQTTCVHFHMCSNHMCANHVSVKPYVCQTTCGLNTYGLSNHMYSKPYTWKSYDCKPYVVYRHTVICVKPYVVCRHVVICVKPYVAVHIWFKYASIWVTHMTLCVCWNMVPYMVVLQTI